jgi:hypothetical protein
MVRHTTTLQRSASELGTSAPGTMHAHASSRALHTRSVVAKAASRVVTREDWKGQCRDAVHGSTVISSAILGCTAQNNPSVGWCPAGRPETTLLPSLTHLNVMNDVCSADHAPYVPPGQPPVCPSHPPAWTVSLTVVAICMQFKVLTYCRRHCLQASKSS